MQRLSAVCLHTRIPRSLTSGTGKMDGMAPQVDVLPVWSWVLLVSDLSSSIVNVILF